MTFAETIRRVESERLDEAAAAIAAGWTPDQHPAICCPTVPPDPPKEARTAQQRREWCNVRASNAGYRADVNRKIAARLQGEVDGERGDTASINIPFAKREKALDSAIKRGVQLGIALRQADHWESRADYWRNRALTIEGEE